MKIAILGAAGHMGSWLVREFSRDHEVGVYDVDQERQLDLKGVRTFPVLDHLASFCPDLLINAVSLENTIPAFEEVEGFLAADCIIADVASVKGDIVDYYKRCPFRFVSVHPMFGPTFANMESLKEENAIIIKESDREGARCFRQLFERLGVRIFEYSFAEHDEMMAYSLTLPFISSMAFSACVNNRVVPGTTFARHMKIAKGLLSEDPHLLAEILFNPYSIPELEKVTAKLEYLKHIIRGRDREELKYFLQDLRDNIIFWKTPMQSDVPGFYVVPFCRDILADLDTPLSCYMKLKKAFPSSPSFLLESAEARDRLGRYSFIGFEPFLVFKSIDKKVFMSGVIEGEFEVPNPFLALKDIMERLKGFGFSDDIGRFSGAVGYVGYDVVQFFEKLPDSNARTLNIYDMYFIFPRKLIIFDNYTRKMSLFVFKIADEDASLQAHHEDGLKELDALQEIIRSPIVPEPERELSVKMMDGNTSKEEFEEMVLQAKKYIHGGDIIQVVLSQRFNMEINVDSLSLYRALRVVNPSPYMFLLDYVDYSLIGSSPETLVKLENGEVEVRPIAGTRRRGKDREEDKQLEKELLADEKERAEHTMLVDLGRNDVGRIAATGSVTVPEFMGVERYSHVMHIVSSVKGTLREGMDAFDVFQATFPAGTVSGAPKIRAMEIIEELEKEKREFYAGCVGYFAYNGDMEFCITIRSLLKKQNRVYIQAGAGIVADSAPDKEYAETIHKAQALVKSIIELREIID